MLRPFKTESLHEIVDMLILSTALDQKLTCDSADTHRETIEHLAACVVELARHNNAVEAARIDQHLNLPDIEEVRTIVREGRTFGVITGGKT